MVLRFATSGEAVYFIQVNNPGHAAQSVKRIELDGQPLTGLSIWLGTNKGGT